MLINNTEQSYMPTARKMVSYLAGTLVSLVLFVAVAYGKWVNTQIVDLRTQQVSNAEQLASIQAKLDVLMDAVGAQYHPGKLH